MKYVVVLLNLLLSLQSRCASLFDCSAYSVVHGMRYCMQAFLMWYSCATCLYLRLSADLTNVIVFIVLLPFRVLGVIKNLLGYTLFAISLLFVLLIARFADGRPSILFCPERPPWRRLLFLPFALLSSYLVCLLCFLQCAGLLAPHCLLFYIILAS